MFKISIGAICLLYPPVAASRLCRRLDFHIARPVVALPMAWALKRTNYGDGAGAADHDGRLPAPPFGGVSGQPEPQPCMEMVGTASSSSLVSISVDACSPLP